jgi:sulfoxide reductase catalytic subunit YedY
MAYRYKSDLSWDDVTPKDVYLNRRQLMAGAGVALGAGLIGGKAQAQDAWDLTPTSFEDATSYNNFYEFGTDKADPARHAHQMTTEPWSVEIDGMVDNPGTYSFEQLVEGQTHGRAYLSLPLRRTLVHGDPVGRLRAEADLLERVGVQSERALRRVRDSACSPDGHAGR